MTDHRRINRDRRREGWPPARGHVHDPATNWSQERIDRQLAQIQAAEDLAPWRGLVVGLAIAVGFWALIILGPPAAEWFIQWMGQ